MGNSALIGSFERKTNQPIEAQYIFPTRQDLIDFFNNNPEWKENLHKGLLKLVENDGSGNLILYWVAPVDAYSTTLKFEPVNDKKTIGWYTPVLGFVAPATPQFRDRIFSPDMLSILQYDGYSWLAQPLVDGATVYNISDNQQYRLIDGLWTKIFRIEEAPKDGNYYIRKDGNWVLVTLRQLSFGEAFDFSFG